MIGVVEDSSFRTGTTDSSGKQKPLILFQSPFPPSSPGTVRGTISITLLVGSLSMAIASLGMDYVIKEDSFIADHFDFFKTAFLMMIAFYFGNKSLEMLGYKSSKGTQVEFGKNAEPKGSSPENLVPPPSNQAAAEAKKTLKKVQTVNSETEPNINTDDFENPRAVQ